MLYYRYSKKSTYEFQGKLRKEENMDEMNDTMRMMIKAIIQIIKDSENKDEALKKIEALLK